MRRCAPRTTPRPPGGAGARCASELYRTHPQSPRPGGEPAYFPYEPALRFEAAVEPVEPAALEIAGSAGSVTRFTRFAVARFGEHALELYWLDAYGGGVFLPFRDATSGRETYGAGRYLLDTVKGADLGGTADRSSSTSTSRSTRRAPGTTRGRARSRRRRTGSRSGSRRAS